MSTNVRQIAYLVLLLANSAAVVCSQQAVFPPEWAQGFAIASLILSMFMKDFNHLSGGLQDPPK